MTGEERGSPGYHLKELNSVKSRAGATLHCGTQFLIAVQGLLISVDPLVVGHGLKGMWASVVAAHGL